MAVNDAAARPTQTPPMSTPSTKEHTVKRIATTALAAVILTLALASVASAHRCMRGLLHGGSYAPAHHIHRAAY